MVKEIIFGDYTFELEVVFNTRVVKKLSWHTISIVSIKYPRFSKCYSDSIEISATLMSIEVLKKCDDILEKAKNNVDSLHNGSSLGIFLEKNGFEK